MSKGSWKRPVFVSSKVLSDNYDRTFGKKPVPGAELFWNDPGGECSRSFVVKEAERHGDFWKITATDGWYIECPQSELS